MRRNENMIIMMVVHGVCGGGREDLLRDVDAL